MKTILRQNSGYRGSINLYVNSPRGIQAFSVYSDEVMGECIGKYLMTDPPPLAKGAIDKPGGQREDW